MLIVIFFVALGFAMLRDYMDNRPLTLEDYTSARLSQHLSDGRCVLVSFHADWDSNTSDPLNRMSSKLPHVVRQHGMAAMSADWTTKPASVTGLMTKLGLQSVPAIAVFTPDNANHPIVLPDRTSEADLLAIIEGLHQSQTRRNHEMHARSP